LRTWSPPRCQRRSRRRPCAASGAGLPRRAAGLARTPDDRPRQALLADHRRVREAAGDVGEYAARASLPVDVLGVCGLLPSAVKSKWSQPVIV
jgi:hypothetical protein